VDHILKITVIDVHRKTIGRNEDWRAENRGMQGWPDVDGRRQGRKTYHSPTPSKHSSRPSAPAVLVCNAVTRGNTSAIGFEAFSPSRPVLQRIQISSRPHPHRIPKHRDPAGPALIGTQKVDSTRRCRRTVPKDKGKGGGLCYEVDDAIPAWKPSQEESLKEQIEGTVYNCGKQ
jgi:hypothetical protein